VNRVPAARRRLPCRRSPAAARNREPIAIVLADHLPAAGLVLEIASGPGEHVVHFARRFSHLVWRPSDRDPANLAGIDAWIAASGLANIEPPLLLDAAATDWPIARADAIVCVNLTHIAPWPVSVGLMRGAARLLPAGGPLYLYGPFRRDGGHTSAGNAAFDRALRADDPCLGLRDAETVIAEAANHGLILAADVAMPANNASLVFRRG